MPFEVPRTIDTAIAMHVGRPKLRFPTSEKTWPVIFLSLVQRTTSHGACGDSLAPTSWIVKAAEELRECALRKAGDEARGELNEDGDARAWNRRSKGRRDGVGL